MSILSASSNACTGLARFIHARSRLVLAGDEAFERDRLQRLAARPVFRAREQRIEAAPQSFELSHGSFLARWWRGLRPAATFRPRARDTLARPSTSYRG